MIDERAILAAEPVTPIIPCTPLLSAAGHPFNFASVRAEAEIPLPQCELSPGVCFDVAAE
jgi:hypothetical protein